MIDMNIAHTNPAADWLEVALGDSWDMRIDEGPERDETWFDLGPRFAPMVRVAVQPDQITVHEFEMGAVVATTILRGDVKRQAPRILTILGID